MTDLPLRERLQALSRQLYFGDSNRAHRFRMGLLAFDIATIVFFIGSSMMEPAAWIYAVDYAIALVLALDFIARISIDTRPGNIWARLETWLDLTVIASLLASMVTENLSFLRIIRTLRLFRSYHTLRDLKRRYTWFRMHEDVIQSSFNLFVFIFFITACVYVVEAGVNPQIRNYLDALYFTVTTLTTTGFGDITLTDTPGRLLAIIIMVVGVSLFLRLIQTIFQPVKVKFPCPDCGLQRHDHDAVHCKHCGRVLNIESDGF